MDQLWPATPVPRRFWSFSRGGAWPPFCRIAPTFLRTGLPIKDGRVQKWPTIISPVVNSRHARRIIMAGPMRSSLWCRGWQRLGGALASLSFEQQQGKQPLICQNLITARVCPRPRPLTHQIFIFFISMESFHMWGFPYREEY